MPIAFDASTNGGTASATSLTWNHTCTGASLLLWVFASSVTDNVTGVTYAGVSMTKIGATVSDALVGFLTLWALIRPTTGVNSVVVTSAVSDTLLGNSASYTGCQTTVPDASTTNSATGVTGLATTLTSNADQSWMIYGTNDSVSVGGYTFTNCTNRQNNGGLTLSDTAAAIHPASAKTLTVDAGVNNNWIGILASFAPDDRAEWLTRQRAERSGLVGNVAY